MAGEGSLLQHLLVAPLQRAVALAQVHDVPVAVGDHLDLDVPRRLEVALHVDRAVAERRLRLALRGHHRLGERLAVARHLHAPPAAAGRRLDQHGKADRLGRGHGLLDGGHPAVRARHHGYARLGRGLLGADLVAHHPDVLGTRADEGQAVRLDDLGELGVLAEEAVARVHRLRPGDLGRGDDRGHVQIALGRRRRADAHALVGHAHPHARGVRLRVHGHGGHAHLAAGADHAQRDLAAVGDEDLVEHGCQSMTASGSPNSIGWPSAMRICLTTPARGAGIGFIVFIASTMNSVCPSLTWSPTLAKAGAPGWACR